MHQNDLWQGGQEGYYEHCDLKNPISVFSLRVFLLGKCNDNKIGGGVVLSKNEPHPPHFPIAVQKIKYICRRSLRTCSCTFSSKLAEIENFLSIFLHKIMLQFRIDKMFKLPQSVKIHFM